LLLVPMISNGHVPGTMPIHVNPIVALTSLVVGDMLGILMLSPPLLWLLGHLWRRPCACRSARACAITWKVAQCCWRGCA
jgi:hypothetical protein